MKPDLEQSLANLRDTMGYLWYALYQGCLAAGFDQRQAFTLTQTYILANGLGTIRPNDADGPQENKV
jgi:hypothetical protein